MKRCPRCQIRPVQAGEMCNTCNVNVAFNHAIAKMEDETEIVEHHVFERIKKGCNECGNQDFGYNAGVKEENGLKWFVIQVHCDKCEARYEEIMEVRVTDEPNENDESE